jgi:hypothetical protein
MKQGDTSGEVMAGRSDSFRVKAAVLAALVLAACAMLAIPSFREAMLRGLGAALVVDETVTASDVVVVSVDAAEAGLLEAADLVRSGVARQVFVFAPQLETEDLELKRRGILTEDAATRYARLLGALGVANLAGVTRVSGTEEQVRALPDICRGYGFRSVIVVTARDHSRRVQRGLDRTMKGQGVTVVVVGSRYSAFDPDRWWQTRDGARTEVVELQKLILDYAIHPF